MNSKVTVEEITTQNARELLGKYLALDSKLGVAQRESMINSFLETLRDRKMIAHRFLLHWTGHKVPVRACVLEHQIAWTQSGVVRCVFGRTIGSYDRLIEFGGASHKEQVMIIYLPD